MLTSSPTTHRTKTRFPLPGPSPPTPFPSPPSKGPPHSACISDNGDAVAVLDGLGSEATARHTCQRTNHIIQQGNSEAHVPTHQSHHPAAAAPAGGGGLGLPTPFASPPSPPPPLSSPLSCVLTFLFGLHGGSRRLRLRRRRRCSDGDVHGVRRQGLLGLAEGGSEALVRPRRGRPRSELSAHA